MQERIEDPCYFSRKWPNSSVSSLLDAMEDMRFAKSKIDLYASSEIRYFKSRVKKAATQLREKVIHLAAHDMEPNQELHS